MIRSADTRPAAGPATHHPNPAHTGELGGPVSVSVPADLVENLSLVIAAQEAVMREWSGDDLDRLKAALAQGPEYASLTAAMKAMTGPLWGQLIALCQLEAVHRLEADRG